MGEAKIVENTPGKGKSKSLFPWEEAGRKLLPSTSHLSLTRAGIDTGHSVILDPVVVASQGLSLSHSR